MEHIDTISMYRDQVGVRYKIYKYQWFPPARNFSYCWNPNNESFQDSLVLYVNGPFYVKFYDGRGRKTFEGLSCGARLIGDIKFYYPSGQLKKVEHWNYQQIDTICGLPVFINSERGPEGVWKSFRRNGTMRFIKDYYIHASSCDPMRCSNVERIKFYGRNGKLRRVKETEYESW